MNAETRTLLQVKMEDVVSAEEIFTTLMGEVSKNRRKFIEENALDVVNLDVYEIKGTHGGRDDTKHKRVSSGGY